MSYVINLVKSMDESQKPLINLHLIEVEEPPLTHYIRTTWMLSAKTNLKISEFCEIRHFTALEAEKLGAQVSSHNIFARTRGGDHFYVSRARELGDHTVIEVFLPGEPKEISDEAGIIASTLEKIAVLSLTIAMKKAELQKRLGISTALRTYFHFSFSPDFYSINSKIHSSPDCKGIIIDDRFQNRFFSCGFNTIVDYLRQKNDIGIRLSQSIDWLFESRTEPRLQAAVVKTATALESLLLFNETESIGRSLSERIAFIISSDPIKRRQIDKIIKDFYNFRSGVVHGNQRKIDKYSPMLLESVDRIAIMVCLVIAANSTLWTSMEALKDWCETQRWGVPSIVNIPFPVLYLDKAMNLSQQGQ
jgi:hypothetical protein